MTNKAVLLANLGSPDHHDSKSVARYLNQFLMDPYVIQLPWLLRRLIVSAFVLPTRPKASAAAYRSIWTEQGSPLIALSEQLRQALQQRESFPVAMAMRYGQPSIENQILSLAREKQVEQILYIPLYPHFADSTVTTSVQEAERVIKKHKLKIKLDVFQSFYQDPAYINALVASAAPYLSEPYDHLVFSYHGLPELQITKLDKSKKHCLKRKDCCQIANPAHASCYRHQIFRTTQLFAEAAELQPERYSVAFQSRLGRAKWLSPSTEETLIDLAKQGKKNVLVICPAFVTDCLETLEEIAIRGNEVFIEAGGESLTLIPCLNAAPEWVDVLSKWCEQY